MRIDRISALAAAALLASCGPKPLSLPEGAIDKAATCGVIAAASERNAAGLKGDLPADGQARIFHYALLGASHDGTIDRAQADAIFKRMPALSESVTQGEWQKLQPGCRQAFPATATTDPKLPAATPEAAQQCYALADFLRKAMGELPGSYSEAAVRYSALSTKLDTRVARAVGKTGVTEQKRERDKALAAAAALGQPPAVITACEKKFS